MSNSSKGAAIERLAVELLEANGFVVHRTIRTPVLRGGMIRGSHSNDIFGVFDLIAMRARVEHASDFFNQDLLMVQVTTKGEARRRERKVEPIAKRSPDHVDVEVWAFVGGRRDDGGQVFRRTTWNGLEWAERGTVATLAKKRPKKPKKNGAKNDEQRGAKATRKDSAAEHGDGRPDAYLEQRERF